MPGHDCKNMVYNCAIGQCTTCPRYTPSKGMKYCMQCAQAKNACAYCGEKLGQPTERK